MKRRVLAIVLAVLLAVLGAGAVLAYVRQADQRALQGQKAVTVVVALKTIPSGTSLRVAAAQNLLRRETFPASSVPANAVSAVTTALQPLVVSYQIPSGTVLITPMLVTAAQATGGVALPTNQVAVTIALCVPEAVAGAVRAGSLVDVFDTFTLGGAKTGLTASYGCSGAHQQQSPTATGQVTSLANIQVLSVGPAATGQSSSTPGSTAPTTTGTGTTTDSPPASTGTVLVTFAATLTQAKELIHLSVTGLPYLVLVRP